MLVDKVINDQSIDQKSGNRTKIRFISKEKCTADRAAIIQKFAEHVQQKMRGDEYHELLEQFTDAVSQYILQLNLLSQLGIILKGNENARKYAAVCWCVGGMLLAPGGYCVGFFMDKLHNSGRISYPDLYVLDDIVSKVLADVMLEHEESVQPDANAKTQFQKTIASVLALTAEANLIYDAAQAVRLQQGWRSGFNDTISTALGSDSGVLHFFQRVLGVDSTKHALDKKIAELRRERDEKAILAYEQSRGIPPTVQNHRIVPA